MPFDYTPLRDALKRMHARMGHGTWAHIGRASGLSPAAISIIAHKDKMVDTVSWDKLYAAFPDEIPAPPWHKSRSDNIKIVDSKIPGLGERLRQAREDAGLSMEHAAQVLAVSIELMDKWESGRSDPPLSMLVKICDLYDINAHLLLTGKPAPLGLSDAVKAVMKSEPGRMWTVKEVTEAVNKLIESGQFKIQF